MLIKAVEDGMLTLLQDGIRKVLQGLTTYRQVRAVASNSLTHRSRQPLPAAALTRRRGPALKDMAD